MKIRGTCAVAIMGLMGIVAGCASESASDDVSANPQPEVSSSRTSVESRPSSEGESSAKLLCSWQDSKYYDNRDDCLAWKRIDQRINDLPVYPEDESCFVSPNHQYYYWRCI